MSDSRPPRASVTPSASARGPRDTNRVGDLCSAQEAAGGILARTWKQGERESGRCGGHDSGSFVDGVANSTIDGVADGTADSTTAANSTTDASPRCIDATRTNASASTLHTPRIGDNAADIGW